MMWVVGCVIGVGIIVALERAIRSYRWRTGPHYVDQLRRWHESEPTIPALPLPTVKGLIGKPEGGSRHLEEVLPAHVRPFKKRRKAGEAQN
mgnify:CR=1 FL=1